MRLKHLANVYSEYDFIDVENEGEEIETWTYMVYLNKECSIVLELVFEVHFAPERDFKMVQATTITYADFSKPCSICGKTEFELCDDFEAEKEIYDYDTEHAYLHECGFTDDELLDLAIEIYMDDNFEDMLSQEEFDELFIIEKKDNSGTILYETTSSNRYVVKGNKVYHFYKNGIESDECPFCETKEWAVYNEKGCWLKCSILTKNIYLLKKYIKNSKQEPVGLPL